MMALMSLLNVFSGRMLMKNVMTCGCAYCNASHDIPNDCASPSFVRRPYLELTPRKVLSASRMERLCCAVLKCGKKLLNGRSGPNKCVNGRCGWYLGILESHDRGLCSE